jgi:hypothetical protein
LNANCFVLLWCSTVTFATAADCFLTGNLLAVLIPVPGGEMVWQAHCPLDVFQQKGLSFDPVTGEARASSHASMTDDADHLSTNDVSSSSSSSSSSIKERALKAFDTFPDAFLNVMRATPADAITQHGLYQRTVEQIPEESWGSGMVTLTGGELSKVHCWHDQVFMDAPILLQLGTAEGFPRC